MSSRKSVLSIGRRLTILRARVFGDVVRNTSESDMRVVQMFARPPWQRNLGSWYPPTHSSLLIRLQRLGLFHDEHSNFRQQMAIQRRARGKGPPEKGEGKQKKKKKR